MSQLIPRGDEWTAMKNQAQILVTSQFLPKTVDTAQKAIAIMMMGRELGVGPMESFSKISVIQGKPTMGAELMKAMVHKKLPQAKFRIAKSDESECVIEAARPGEQVSFFTFTMKDAERMNLTSKDNWKKMPKVMLRWRAISDVCRTVFPDCLSGISYTPEELGANVNEEGKIIDLDEKDPAPVVPLKPIVNTTPVVAPPEVVDLPHEEVPAIVGVIPNPASPDSAISQNQRKRLFAIMKEKGWTQDELKVVMKGMFNYDSTRLLGQADYDLLVRVVEAQTFKDAMEDLK